MLIVLFILCLRFHCRWKANNSREWIRNCLCKHRLILLCDLITLSVNKLSRRAFVSLTWTLRRLLITLSNDFTFSRPFSAHVFVFIIRLAQWRARRRKPVLPDHRSSPNWFVGWGRMTEWILIKANISLREECFKDCPRWPLAQPFISDNGKLFWSDGGERKWMRKGSAKNRKEVATGLCLISGAG